MDANQWHAKESGWFSDQKERSKWLDLCSLAYLWFGIAVRAASRADAMAVGAANESFVTKTAREVTFRVLDVVETVRRAEIFLVFPSFSIYHL